MLCISGFITGSTSSMGSTSFARLYDLQSTKFKILQDCKIYKVQSLTFYKFYTFYNVNEFYKIYKFHKIYKFYKLSSASVGRFSSIFWWDLLLLLLLLAEPPLDSVPEDARFWWLWEQLLRDPLFNSWLYLSCVCWQLHSCKRSWREDMC